MINRILYIVSVFVFCACSEKELDYTNYIKYLKDIDHGLIQKKIVGEVQVTVKFLPNDYLAYNEIKNDVSLKNRIDSLKKTYQNSTAFILNFSPVSDERIDITKAGVKDYEEFSERILKMSFKMSEMIKLKTEKNELAPSITQLERNYGLQNGTDIMVVFNIGKDSLIKNSSKIDFEYSDEIFRTGLTKYSFLSENIKNIPELKFN